MNPLYAASKLKVLLELAPTGESVFVQVTNRRNRRAKLGFDCAFASNGTFEIHSALVKEIIK